MSTIDFPQLPFSIDMYTRFTPAMITSGEVLEELGSNSIILRLGCQLADFVDAPKMQDRFPFLAGTLCGTLDAPTLKNDTIDCLPKITLSAAKAIWELNKEAKKKTTKKEAQARIDQLRRLPDDILLFRMQQSLLRRN